MDCRSRYGRALLLHSRNVITIAHQCPPPFSCTHVRHGHLPIKCPPLPPLLDFLRHGRVPTAPPEPLRPSLGRGFTGGWHHQPSAPRPAPAPGLGGANPPCMSDRCASRTSCGRARMRLRGPVEEVGGGGDGCLCHYGAYGSSFFPGRIIRLFDDSNSPTSCCRQEGRVG